MRRSFRTRRLFDIPGVSPRAGMRCPVGALRTPHLPRVSLRAQDLTREAPVEALIPSASSGTLPPQNRSEHPGVCGVPSERSGCAAYPGFHLGLVCGAPLGHSERLTFPEASCTSTKREPSEDMPLKDMPLNDVPLSKNPSTTCGWIPSPQWSPAQAFCAIIPLWRA